jgi:hypothetical protein
MSGLFSRACANGARDELARRLVVAMITPASPVRLFSSRFVATAFIRAIRGGGSNPSSERRL